MLPDDVTREGQRVLTICNACRYCEAYCPVFPAMERHTSFESSDLTYLANLCHNCGECLYACQYAPPHEFGVNIPRTLAQIRVASYDQYCWPHFLGFAFRRSGIFTALIISLLASAIVACLAVALARAEPNYGHGDFYAVVPHQAMMVLFGGVSIIVGIALSIGFLRLWRDLKGGQRSVANRTSIVQGFRDALTLSHLDNDGVDCTNAEETRSPFRRWFHHLTSYGFGLCFASTCVAATYHAFGWHEPYPYTSLPVLLGTSGGLALLVGPIGLFAMQRRRDPALADPTQHGMEESFLALLVLTALSGLLLLILRDGAAMRALLIGHLGCVLGLFVTLPYGKFVHGIYRTAALVKYAAESSGAGEATRIVSPGTGIL